MSDFTQSTLTSPRSPLFSDSCSSERQSGSEIVTSDEEPDLGAFTAVLRAWGYLQPPLRIPAHFPSSSSSRTRSTPTTITGYPGFGGGNSETVEESTVWNQIPIQSYFRASYGTDTSSGRTERARPLLEELDDEEYSPSPPPSPASESARTVEIASDAASVRSVTYEDGTSGERLVVAIDTPPSIDGRTVSVASGAESHDEQTHFASPPAVQPVAFGPHLPVVNDNTLSSLSSTSPTPSQPYSISNQILNDNTTISRQRPSPSTLSIVSYQPQMSALRTQSSVFQETPSPAFPNIPPFQETTTSSSPPNLLDQTRSSARRVVSNSSHAESDIINSYYTREPGTSSPSTDQPASDFPWPRRLEILTQPPSSEPNHQQPLLEQESPLTENRQTPSVIDDNSTSVITDETPPPSTTMSDTLSMLQEIPVARSESPGVSSSHSLTPSHTVALPITPTSTSTSTTTAAATTTGTVNHIRQSSMESSTVHNIQYPSFSSTYREQQPRSRGRIDSAFQGMQTATSRLHYHLLSSEGEPVYEQPSLGYLDEALSFIAAERARLTAAREAGMHREPSPSLNEEEREEQGEMVATRQDGRWRYAIEPQHIKKLKKHLPQHKSSSLLESLGSTDADSTGSTNDRPRTLTSSNDHSSMYENVVMLNSPNASPKKIKKMKNMSQLMATTSTNGIIPISILKRPERAGDSNNASSSSTLFSNSSHKSHSQSHTHAIASSSTHAHASTIVGSSPPTQTKYDGASTPRAHTYLYASSSDNYGSVDDEEGDEEEEEFTEGENDNHQRRDGDEGDWYIGKYDRRGQRLDAGGNGSANTTGAVYKSTPRAGSRVDLSLEEGEEEGEEEDDREDESGDLVRGNEGDEKVIGTAKGKKKEKKKKKKAKKRKVPVTIPTPLSKTLSHSRSVPNLRADVENTAYSSPEENGSGGGINTSGAGLSGPATKSSLSSSLSLPESKRWNTGKQAVDSLVFHGDASSNIAPTWLGQGQSKRVRLVALAQHLQNLFPAEEAPLRKVIGKLGGCSPSDAAGTASKEGKKKKKFATARLLDDCSLDYSSLADSDLQRAEFGEEDPDPRGDVPGKKDTLVHVFIDHSNILIGFLNNLKRRPKILPSTIKPVTQQSTQDTSSATTAYNNNIASRPLPIPRTKAGVPIPEAKPLIPLPSFAMANLSRSLPSTSFIQRAMVTKNEYAKDASSEGDEYVKSGYDDDDQEDDTPVFEFDDEGYGFKEPEHTQRAADSVKPKKKKKKSQMVTKRVPRHMWHAALTLILERGRPVTRRVVAASKPLHQPMETIERLGYEVKIFMRVPDFGDGADRLEKAAKYEHHRKESHNGSPTKGHSSPTKTSSKTHARRISGNMSGDVGFGISTAAATSNSAQQSASTRVKYREQGVDELLQLKLHLAITAPDEVPEGATIVLATGDGNVGQFNEDGFLGAVRTALKRGWRVELYAWEDCLSRSWRREFGPNSEWGRKGMFRVITLDQFAECLVELGG